MRGCAFDEVDTERRRCPQETMESSGEDEIQMTSLPSGMEIPPTLT
jgi:hypothetical protein